MKFYYSLKFKTLFLFTIFFSIISILSIYLIFLTYKEILKNEEQKINDYSIHFNENLNNNINFILKDFNYIINLELNVNIKNSINFIKQNNIFIYDIVILYNNNYLYKLPSDLNTIIIKESENVKNGNYIYEKFFNNNKFLIFLYINNEKRIFFIIKLSDNIFINEKRYEETNYLWEIIVTNYKGDLLFNTNKISEKYIINNNVKEYPSVKNALYGNWGLQKIIIDKKRYYSLSKISNINDWIIIIQIPANILVTNVIKIILPLFIILSIIIIFLFFIWFVFNKIIINPIVLLKDCLNQYSQNNNFKISYKYNDEIGEVIDSFKNMILLRNRLEKEILEISENERKRIGIDLHDDLGQILTGILYYLMAMEEFFTNNKKELYNELINLTKTAINKTKIIAKMLCPVNLIDNGIIYSIEELIINLKNIYNIKIDFIYDNDIIIIDETLCSNLYYIIQEALTNSIKHSGCSEIFISLKKQNKNIILIIRDNGRGFNNDKKDGMGLKNIKYRSNLINGDLKIISNNSGTEISLIFNTGENND